MVQTPTPTPHALLPLFPQFLRKRRAGFPGLAPLIEEAGLSRPAFFMLLRAAGLPPAGATAAELRPGAPYATRDPHFAQLDEAATRGYFTVEHDGRYRLTDTGWDLVARLERTATDYLAALRPLPHDELTRLADRFAAIAAGLDEQAGGPAAHLHRGRRIAALTPEAGRAPLVRLERAIFDLWMARDDAHIGAWRMARFPGPALEVLTYLWRGEVETLDALQEALAATHDSLTVEELVEELIEQGYVARRGDTLQPTRAGYNVRETIESDTDDLYFHQWPPLAPDEIAWLHDTLRRVIAALPDHR